MFLMLRPMLMEENKLLRIAWCCDRDDHNTRQYSEMLDIIHG